MSTPTIRDAVAASALATWRELGVRIDLIHAGATTSGLIAQIEKNEETASAKTGISEECAFVVPLQPGFDGTTAPGDVIAFPAGGAERFAITKTEADPHGALWRLNAVRAASGTAATAVASAAFALNGTAPAVSLGTPLSAKIRESSEPVLLHAPAFPGPAGVALAAQALTVTLTLLELNPALAPGAKGTLVLALKQTSGAVTTITLAGLKVCAIERDLLQPPFTASVQFRHEGTLASPAVQIT